MTSALKRSVGKGKNTQSELLNMYEELWVHADAEEGVWTVVSGEGLRFFPPSVSFASYSEDWARRESTLRKNVWTSLLLKGKKKYLVEVRAAVFLIILFYKKVDLPAINSSEVNSGKVFQYFQCISNEDSDHRAHVICINQCYTCRFSHLENYCLFGHEVRVRSQEQMTCFVKQSIAGQQPNSGQCKWISQTGADNGFIRDKQFDLGGNLFFFWYIKSELMANLYFLR